MRIGFLLSILLLSITAFAQVDTLVHIKPIIYTKQDAAGYKFKQVRADSGLHVLKNARFDGSTQFTGVAYSKIPSLNDSSQLIANTAWVKRQGFGGSQSGVDTSAIVSVAYVNDSILYFCRRSGFCFTATLHFPQQQADTASIISVNQISDTSVIFCRRSGYCFELVISSVDEDSATIMSYILANKDTIQVRSSDTSFLKYVSIGPHKWELRVFLKTVNDSSLYGYGNLSIPIADSVFFSTNYRIDTVKQQMLRKNGSVPLTASWSTGDFAIKHNGTSINTLSSFENNNTTTNGDQHSPAILFTSGQNASSTRTNTNQIRMYEKNNTSTGFLTVDKNLNNTGWVPYFDIGGVVPTLGVYYLDGTRYTKINYTGFTWPGASLQLNNGFAQSVLLTSSSNSVNHKFTGGITRTGTAGASFLSQFVSIEPTISIDAGNLPYSALFLNVTESSASGTNYLLRAQKNATDYFNVQNNGQTGVGTVATTSAMLEIASTSKGLLMPRMTTTQRIAIAAPSAGLMVYDSDLKRVMWYNSTSWTSEPGVTTGTAAPSTTPVLVGDMFVDTANKKIYVATGTTSSTDWTILN